MNEPIWDIIVIGGGIVGCAITRRFALGGARVLLLERGADILSGASKANSAILHTGFDAPPDSVELACMKAGYQEYLAIHGGYNLPILHPGALVVAWDEEQRDKLAGIVEKAHTNGVGDVALIEQHDLRTREPQLNEAAQGAVYVPGEKLIDPWSSPLAYLTHAVDLGAQYRFSTEVTKGDFDGKNWHLHSAKGSFAAKLVINCTGTHGDIVEEICGEPDFEIRPRKGQFLVYDKSAAPLISSIILPVPTNITKGIVLTHTIFGNLLLGPTAEEQQNRLEARVDEEKLQELIDIGTTMLPGLKYHQITATYAGLRPATQFKDYQIKATPEKNWVGVNGIRSTGLTSALGIAAYVENICNETFPNIAIPLNTHPLEGSWPKMPILAQHAPRTYQTGDGTEIICHCENVTRGEIERALSSKIPAQNLGGLRRRTRAMMGRCNGFYCSAKIAELTKDRLDISLSVGDANE